MQDWLFILGLILYSAEVLFLFCTKMKYCTFCRPSRYKLIVKAKLKIEKLLRSKVVNRFEVLVGFINTSYLTDSYISFTLKLESRQNFCSNRSIRSSTYGKKNIFEIPPCGSHFLVIHFTY